ncbi:poly(U)-specific 3'-to-5' RNA exonuclease [Mortierella sp. AD032]|nr:poly(U)-specific 3'-to-5' RNA exonuclease [Mortierella sp. AD032]
MPLVDYRSSSDEGEEIQDKRTTPSLGGAQQPADVISTKSASDPQTTPNVIKVEYVPVPILMGRGLSTFTLKLFDIVSTLTRTAQSLAPSTVSMLQSITSQEKKNSVPVKAESAEDASELHISLTRPIYLQELHLGRFASDVRDIFKSRKRFNINFSGLQSFSNDDQTRSFLSLRVGAGHAQLESLVADMDVIAQRYSQPKFYPDPEFHASFAWALGGGVLDSKIVEAMPELDGELGHDLRHCSIGVKRVSWKIGQKTGSEYMIALLEQPEYQSNSRVMYLPQCSFNSYWEVKSWHGMHCPRNFVAHWAKHNFNPWACKDWKPSRHFNNPTEY